MGGTCCSCCCCCSGGGCCGPPGPEGGTIGTPAVPGPVAVELGGTAVGSVCEPAAGEGGGTGAPRAVGMMLLGVVIPSVGFVEGGWVELGVEVIGGIPLEHAGDAAAVGGTDGA